MHVCIRKMKWKESGKKKRNSEKVGVAYMKNNFNKSRLVLRPWYTSFAIVSVNEYFFGVLWENIESQYFELRTFTYKITTFFHLYSLCVYLRNEGRSWKRSRLSLYMLLYYLFTHTRVHVCVCVVCRQANSHK